MNRLLAVCVAVLCSGAMISQTPVRAQTAGQGFATLYIFAVSSFAPVQASLAVTENGITLATIGANQYAIRRVAPGRHVLKPEVRPEGSVHELTIDAAAGQNYYIKYEAIVNVLPWLSKVTFAEISKVEADTLLAKLTPADDQSAVLGPTPPVRIYIASSGNDQIVRINDMTGAGWTSFGSRGSGANQFVNPTGVFVDALRKLFVADADNHRIVRFNDMVGTGWTTFGSQGSGMGQFNSPRGIFVDANGKIFVADTNNHRIIRINDMTGAGWTAFGSQGSETGQFDSPHDIYVDPTGKLFVTDTNNHRIVRVNDMTGAGWITFGTLGDAANQWLGPAGVFVDAGGRAFVTDAGNHRIVRINGMTGADWTSFGQKGNGAGQFLDPNGIFVGPTGQIFVTDSGGNRLARMESLTDSGWVTFEKGGPNPDGNGRLIRSGGDLCPMKSSRRGLVPS